MHHFPRKVKLSNGLTHILTRTSSSGTWSTIVPRTNGPWWSVRFLPYQSANATSRLNTRTKTDRLGCFTRSKPHGF